MAAGSERERPAAEIGGQSILPLLREAENIARMGGEVCRRYFGRGIEVEMKADRTPVTLADREAEGVMRRHIETVFADHQVLGEEAGLSGAGGGRSRKAAWKWLLDPIDGTYSFIHQIPLYTVLVSLLYGDDPVLGVIYNPQTDELVSAGTGLGCHYNGKPCAVSRIDDLSQARLLFSEPTPLLKLLPEAADLLRSVGNSRSWGDGYGYLLLATGRAEIMIDPEMNLWDIACLMPIVREAGGTFTDIHGRSKLGESALATNGHLHNVVLQKLHPAG